MGSVIHCITNVVTVNDCANILLALGASPVMAHHEKEVYDVTSSSDALVCNMGAMESYEAMLIAGKRAKELGHPIVLDPVGVANAKYRRELCFNLINEIKPDCIRGNASEIKALYLNETISAGVDAKENDSLTEEMLQELSKRFNTIIVVSGEKDIVCDKNAVHYVEGGSKMFKCITGAGCMGTVVIAAFMAKEKSILSVCDAVALMKEAGKNAENSTIAKNGGTMTFKNELIDFIYLKGYNRLGLQ